MKKENLIELGTSYKPHGIKGGFLFKLHNSMDSVLSNGIELTIFPATNASSVSKGGQVIQVDSIHFGNKTVCYFKGIRDRNIVEDMLPFEIYLPRDQFPEPDEDEIYINDLIGIKVFDIDGYEIGVVESFFDNGAQVVLKVKLEKEKIELPFVETFFPDVDMKKRRLTMILPEYD